MKIKENYLTKNGESIKLLHSWGNQIGVVRNWFFVVVQGVDHKIFQIQDKVWNLVLHDNPIIIESIFSFFYEQSPKYILRNNDSKKSS